MFSQGQILAHVETYPVRHNLARAQEVLGKTDAALANYEAALGSSPGDDEGERPSILHQMAGIRDAQGEPNAAMELYRQSLDIEEGIGNARGEAATLANIAHIQAAAGDTKAAVTSLRQSAAFSPASVPGLTSPRWCLKSVPWPPNRRSCTSLKQPGSPPPSMRSRCYRTPSIHDW